MVDCGIVRLKLFWLKLDLLEAEEAQQVRQHLLSCETCKGVYDATETESVEPVVRALIRERLVRRTMSKLVDARTVLASGDNMIEVHVPFDSAESPSAPRLDFPLRLDGDRLSRSVRRKRFAHVRLVAVVGGIAATIVIGLFVAELLHNRRSLDGSSDHQIANATIADVNERVISLRARGRDSEAEALLRSFITAGEHMPALRDDVAEARLSLGSLLRDRAEGLLRRARTDERSVATHSRQLDGDTLIAARSIFHDAAQLLLQAADALQDDARLFARLREEMVSLYDDWRVVDPDVSTDHIANDLRHRIDRGAGTPP